MEEEINPKDYGVTTENFLQWRSPIRGEENPQRVESLVWEWLFRSRLSAYAATDVMRGPSPFEAGPTQCFDRFGQSKTELSDGRTVYIGGEHEDGYDPDFFIYNDIVVESAEGELEFYCYPVADFPPTDFHSATLVGDKIVVIGNLSYPGNRAEQTQVLIVNVADFTVKQVLCNGQSPGWIHKQTAQLSADQKSIVIKGGLLDVGEKSALRENIDDWTLDIETWTWQKLTSRQWPRLELYRRDKKRNHLYNIRQVLWCSDVRWHEHFKESLDRLEKDMGVRVNFQAIKDLYVFDFNHESMIEDEEEYNLYYITVNGVRIRFLECSRCLQVTIEGELPPTILAALRTELLAKLEALEQTNWSCIEY